MATADEITENVSLISKEFTNPELDYLATSAFDKEKLKEQWNSIVDQPLIDWGQRPGFEDEDGLVSPSSEAVTIAYRIVKSMRTQESPLPTDVIADGEGGIVFEYHHSPWYERLEINEVGRIELLTFCDSKLQSRQVI